ncbi:hypothetical protein DH2020_008481 [Rehmannia glutinosa]|uniref:Protein kinase domain-containing protein n=1 Tax=Rehmannia glutinosa TaxID=99300 RepID=A0ABR0X4L2_REHGL
MSYHVLKAGGKLVMFKSPRIKSLKPSTFLKKTMKLSNKDVIGSGGYGTVYKVVINDCISFAVKRLIRLSAEQDRGFERELEAMGDIKHRNIVTLHGYYTAPQYNLLIYELMPNGSLDSLLHGKSTNKMVLDWPSRYKIAVGTARGISYLHHDCIPHIIHRDIKSSNILLDHNLMLEIFRYRKSNSKRRCLQLWCCITGAPNGKKPTDEAFVEEGTKLVTWVKSVVQEKREEYVIDNSLTDCPADEINLVFSIALMCLEPEPSTRPTMAEVLKMLEQIRPEEFRSRT